MWPPMTVGPWNALHRAVGCTVDRESREDKSSNQGQVTLNGQVGGVRLLREEEEEEVKVKVGLHSSCIAGSVHLAWQDSGTLICLTAGTAHRDTTPHWPPRAITKTSTNSHLRGYYRCLPWKCLHPFSVHWPIHSYGNYIEDYSDFRPRIPIEFVFVLANCDGKEHAFRVMCIFYWYSPLRMQGSCISSAQLFDKYLSFSEVKLSQYASQRELVDIWVQAIAKYFS